VFEKNCAVCHQIGGTGAVVGPQLDGVGTRGLERLIEDVLDSNRNVDPAFRASTSHSRTIRHHRLLHREEGELMVFADTTRREIAVRKSEIAELRESELSLMPSNLATSCWWRVQRPHGILVVARGKVMTVNCLFKDKHSSPLRNRTVECDRRAVIMLE